MEYDKKEEGPTISVEVIENIIQLLEEYKDRNIPASDYLSEKFLEQCQPQTEDSHCAAITHMFYSIIRAEKLLVILVDDYYTFKNRRRRLDKVLLTVIVYLIVFKLNTNTVQSILDVLLYLHPLKSYHLIQFFSRKDTQTCTVVSACSVFDVQYVKDTILQEDFASSLKAVKTGIAQYFSKQKKCEMELTKPIDMNVLKHEPKKIPLTPTVSSVESIVQIKASPIPLSTYCGPKDAAIILEKQENNRKKARRLFSAAQKNAFKCAKEPDLKFQRNQETIKIIEEERKPLPPLKSKKIPHSHKVSVPVKLNTATMLREAAKFVKDDEKVIKRLETVSMGGGDSELYEKFLSDLQQQREQEELADIKKKHLKGLLTHEEVILARQQYQKMMKDRREHFKLEQEEWNSKLEQLRVEEEMKLQELSKKCKEIRDCAKNSKKDLLEQKHKLVQNMIQETRQLLEESLKAREEELLKKIQLIKEIRTLQSIRAMKVREFDPTMSSGIGSLSEMSIAELRERLYLLKIDLNEELEERQEKIKKQRRERQKMVSDITKYVEEQRKFNKQNVTKVKKEIELPEDEELELLRRKLQEKRQMRLNNEIINCNE